MTRDAAPRLLAAAFAALAVGATIGLVLAWGEPALRTAGRAIFVLVLVELASLAWRWPRLRPRRVRERAQRLLAMLSDPATHEAYAETSPQVGLVESVLDDWDTVLRERERLDPHALDPEENASLDTFAAEVERLRPGLVPLSRATVPDLRVQQAWRDLVAAADRARARLRPGA